MTNIDLSTLAADMDKALNNKENKELFSSSAMLEKLAFTRVADEERQTEVEKELEGTVKTAAVIEPVVAPALTQPGFTVSASVSTLVKLSEELDTAGFSKLSAASLLLAEKLIVEAKAKKSKDPKKDSKKSEKDKASKSKSKKMTREERMKKMRDMKKKKDSGRASKKK